MFKYLFLLAFLTGCAAYDAAWKKDGYCLPICVKYSTFPNVDVFVSDGLQACVCHGRITVLNNGQFKQVPATATIRCTPDCPTVSETLNK